MVKYIITHKSPDTDTICSGIAYSYYLNERGIESKVIKLGNLNNETKFILNEFNFKEPELIEELKKDSEIILVDHNEAKQSINNRENYKITQIIDHHKINLSTDYPLYMRVEPIGSTCSIVAKILFEENIKITKEIASILISAIISDTLYFRSPTTTKEDIELVEKLNEIAKIEDLEKFSLEMFKNKSNLGNISIEELIKIDYKEFIINDKKIGVGVLETTDPNYSLNKKDEIVTKMNELIKNEGLDHIFLSIIDILNETNKTIFPNEKTELILKKAFNCETKNNIAELGRIISRKKQIIPQLEKELNNN